jgi:hypothetical protein
MAHYLGAFLKYVAALVIFIFSVSLSYTFFSHIAPHNMPWFTWSALGLTEFGLLLWLFVMILQRHVPASKTIALVMVGICFAGVLFTDAMELADMFGIALIVAGVYYYGLIGLLCAHLLAFVIDILVGYFSKYSFFATHSPTAQPKAEAERQYQQGYEQHAASFAQTATEPAAPKGPGVLSRATSSLAASVVEAKDLTSEKVATARARRSKKDAPVEESPSTEQVPN